MPAQGIEPYRLLSEPVHDAQWSQLQQAFPTGVCDYTKPGVNQQATVPWMTYKNGPGGQPLGNAPQSVAF